MIDDRLRHPQALRRAPGRVLERAMREGTRPALDSIEGWVFRGWNTLWLTRVLGFQKFAKGFYRGPSGTMGYNVVVRQNANWDPHVSKPNEDAPKRMGFYRVEAAPKRYPSSLFLDYGRGGNGLHPALFLRDYLVQPWEDEPDLLLGKAYVAVGLWVPVSYFVLSRWKESSFRGNRSGPS